MLSGAAVEVVEADVLAFDVLGLGETLTAPRIVGAAQWMDRLTRCPGP
jgi:hypothetical protein